MCAKSAGDTFYVASDHAETQASAMTNTSPGIVANMCFIICVDHTGTVPPVSADLRTTATISTTGASNITNAGTGTVCYGIEFKAGSGASTANVANSGGWKMIACKLTLNNTSASSAITASGGGTGRRTEWVNTVCTFGATGQRIAATSSHLIWRDTASALGGATFPTNLFVPSAEGCIIELQNLDLSALGSGKTIFGTPVSLALCSIRDCKLGASVTICTAPTSPNLLEVYVSRADSAGTNYIEQLHLYQGAQTDETVIVRTSGNSDGTTAKSMKVVTTANCRWQVPFNCTPIVIWNDTSGSGKTATIEGVFNAAALPTNEDVWFEVSYPSDASYPIGSTVSGGKADLLASASNLTASTVAWDSLVTARANSTAYSLGDVRKVASNSGRIFFCTTAGTSAGSEPAGYATAVDGGSVTDNTAVFRAGVRFKQAVSFTPQMKGPVTVYPRVGKVSATVYIDPLITVA